MIILSLGTISVCFADLFSSFRSLSQCIWRSVRETSRRTFVRGRSFALSGMAFLLLGSISAPAHAQVTFAGGTVNFGSANVCPAGQASPAPCSQTVTLNYNVVGSTTFGTINVFTQGSPNLDFTLSSGSTCTGTASAGSACTVNVAFAPLAPGLRMGAVQLFDSSGNLLATTLIYGQGQGPAIAFGPSALTTVFSGTYGNNLGGVALDGAGDVFVALYGSSQVVEIPAGGGAPIPVPASGLHAASGVAVDGAGDLFISDFANNRVVELPYLGSGNYGTQTTVAAGPSEPTGLAVDGEGDLFITWYGASLVVEVPAGCGGGACQTTVCGPAIPACSGLQSPISVAVDVAGNVFIAYQANGKVVKVTPSGVLTTVSSGLYNPGSVALDGAGNVVIADSYNGRLVEVPAGGGAQFTVAGGLSFPGLLALDGAGDIVFGNGFSVVELPRSQPPTVGFAYVTVGASGTQSATIQNIGNQPLNAIAPGLVVGGPIFVQVAGSGTPADCTSSFALTPGATCNLSISFTPQSVGNLMSTATFTDNALNAAPAATQSMALQGIGTLLSQTITFTQNAPASWPDKGTFTVAATASSGLPVSFSASGSCTNMGAVFTMTEATGTCTVAASQAGGAGYPPAPNVTETTAATHAVRAPRVTFGGAPTSAPYNSSFVVTATTTSGVTPTITVTGSCTVGPVFAAGASFEATVTMTIGTGTCKMEANWPGNANFSAASAQQKTTAEKAASGLAWATPAPISHGTQLSATQLDATVNAGLQGTFVYSPAAGTEPAVPKPPATCDTLKVTFTPTLSNDYTKETASVCLVVNP